MAKTYLQKCNPYIKVYLPIALPAGNFHIQRTIPFLSSFLYYAFVLFWCTEICGKKERRANREWRGKGEKYEKEIIYMNPRNIEVSYTKSANTILSNM